MNRRTATVVELRDRAGSVTRALFVAAAAVSACGQRPSDPATLTHTSAAAQARISPTHAPQTAQGKSTTQSSAPEESRMWMKVGERRFAITLTNNKAARAFAAQLPLTLEMSELNGNEKHAELPKALPADASRPGTIHSGDVMLYGTNTLVVFYSTFQSSYSYTRLGRLDDPSDLPEALGPRGVRAVLSKD